MGLDGLEVTLICLRGAKKESVQVEKSIPQGLKPLALFNTYGMAEAMPLTRQTEDDFTGRLADEVSHLFALGFQVALVGGVGRDLG